VSTATAPSYDPASGWGTPMADEFLPALLRAVDQTEARCQGAVRICG